MVLDDFHCYSGIVSPAPTLPELTKPIVELTIPSGGWARVTSSFDPAANTLIIQYAVPNMTLNLWWRIHAPDLGGSAALLFALLIFFSLRRILRRPQSHGHLYCRVCNYDLTPWKPPTPAQPTATCPECGVSTQAKPPLRGRFMLRRILPILGIFLPLFLCSFILWWPLTRPTTLPNRSCFFETYSLPTGQKVSTSVLDLPPGKYGRSTSDLRYYAFTECSEESHWVDLVGVFDTATGRTRSYNMGDASTGSAYFHGYTPDEKEAVYTFSSFPNDDGKGTAKIFCVLLDTLAVREITTVNFTYQLIAPNEWQHPSITAAVYNYNKPQQWAFLIGSGIDAGLLKYSPALFRKMGESKLTVTPPIIVDPDSTLSYSADGKLRLSSDGTLEIIPQTGAVRPLAVITPSFTPSTTLNGRFPVGGPLQIYSGANLLQTIQLDLNISSLGANPVFSSDGRWVLVQGYLNNNPALSLPLTVKCLLFDLSKVQPVDPSSTR